MTQIEKHRKELHQVQKNFKKTKEIYRIDYQKMQILMSRLRNKNESLNKDLLN